MEIEVLKSKCQPHILEDSPFFSIFFSHALLLAYCSLKKTPGPKREDIRGEDEGKRGGGSEGGRWEKDGKGAMRNRVKRRG